MKTQNDFQLFTDVGSKYSNTAVTFSPNGWNLPKGFFHKNNIEDFEGLQLFFSEKTNAVAFKLLLKGKGIKDVPGFIKAKKRGAGCFISSRSFLAKYKIDARRFAGKYQLEEVNDPSAGRLFIMYLKEKKLII